MLYLWEMIESARPPGDAVQLVHHSLTTLCNKVAYEGDKLKQPSVTDAVESLSPPGFRKNRHWAGQFPTGSGYFGWVF